MVTRIRQLLEDKQLTPTQFADLIGVGRPVVSHILSERNKPSLEVVQRIIAAFPEIALSWLLSGTGPMLAENAPTLPPAPAPNEAPPEPASPPAAPVAEPAAPTPLAAAMPDKPASPAQAPQAVLPTPPAVLPVAAPAAVAPPAPRPFRAGRFVPAAASAPVGLAEAPVFPAAPARPAAAPVPAQPVPGPSPAAPLPFPVEAGKTIRRIVIFYQDGSFTDYQPEA